MGTCILCGEPTRLSRNRYCGRRCAGLATAERIRATMKERFWAQAQVGISNECWTWTGARDGNGYGQFCIDHRKTKASRVAWRLTHGADPGEQLVLHRCDNRLCVNPDHLFLGSQMANMQDMAAKGRQWRQRQTHCVNGHAFDAQNTRRVGNQRHCRACDAARKRARPKRTQPLAGA